MKQEFYGIDLAIYRQERAKEEYDTAILLFSALAHNNVKSTPIGVLF